MKKLFFDLEQIEKIAKKIPTPFHIYDEKGIKENAKKLKKAFNWNKNFKEYFAVKANPNPKILEILKKENCGLDCSSYTELMLAEMVNIKNADIMFSSNATPLKDFEYANKLNAIINFDDITDIKIYEENFGLPETISCRYNPGKDFMSNNQIMDSPLEAKYGFTKDQLLEGFEYMVKKGVKNFGLHSFLSSNTLTNEYYPNLAKTLFKTAIELSKETGAKIKFINLSGGIGIPYHPDEKEADIFKIASDIKSIYNDTFIKEGINDVEIYTELGRYMLGPYGALITKAIRKKDIHKNYIGVDACSTDLLRPAVYKAYHHITVLGKENQPLEYKYDITGGLCENNDKFAIDRLMPKINTGDILAIHDTGAHGFSMGYNYNGKLRSSEVLLKEDGSFNLIRRAETPEDYFRTLIY
jgi:diaminopimelate decarboxylase